VGEFSSINSREWVIFCQSGKRKTVIEVFSKKWLVSVSESVKDYSQR